MALIRVKNKQTGETGTIGDGAFDPNIYENLDQPKKERSLLANVLPVLGMVGGGIGGGLLGGPAGALAGGALGGGAGEKFAQDLSGESLDVGKIGLNAAMGAVPFGRGAGILSKVLLPGAGVGALGALTQDNATPQSVLTGAGIGAAGAGVLSKVLPATAGLLGKSSDALEAGGNKMIRSQYNVTPTVAKRLQLGQTVKTLQDYGFSNIGDVEKVVPLVTGDTGIITQMTRDAVGKAGNVDVGGITTIAKKLIADQPLIDNSIGKKFIDVVTRGTMNSGGIMGGDATKMYDFARGLETTASELTSNKLTASASDKALAKVYNGMANEIKDRIFQGAGADNILIKDIITPEKLQQLTQISPKLAEEVSKVKTISQLRSLAKPFVRGGQLVNETAAKSENNIIKVGDIGLGAAGFVGGGPVGGVGGLAISKAVQSNAGKSIIGRVLNKAGAGFENAGSKLNTANPILNGALGQVGSTLPLALAGSIGTTQNQDNYSNGNQNQSSNQVNQVTPPNGSITQDQTQTQLDPSQYADIGGGKILTLKAVNDAIATDLLQNNGKNSDQLKKIKDNFFPNSKEKAIPATVKQRMDLSTSGLRARQDAEDIFLQDPSVVTKGVVSGGLLSRKFDSAMSRAVEGLLRQRSGAAVPDSEVKKYIKDYGPRIGDTKEVALYKLQQLKLDLEDSLKNNGNVGAEYIPATQ